MTAAIIRINELIVTALIFGAAIGIGVAIGLAVRLDPLDARAIGAPDASNIAYYLSHIPVYLSHSLLPSKGYGAI